MGSQYPVRLVRPHSQGEGSDRQLPPESVSETAQVKSLVCLA